VLLPATLNATLVLVRHGESTYVAEGRFQGRSDPPLSSLGERQAQLVGQRLADRNAFTPLPIPAGPPITIWHSPLQRAMQTAQAIADAQPGGIGLRGLPGVTEIAQGDWEGQPGAVVRERWATELAAWRRTPASSHAPGGESLVQAQQRVAGAIDELTHALVDDEAPGANGDQTFPRSFVQGYADPDATGRKLDRWAVVVAHDGIFRVLMLTIFGLPLERFWSFPFNLCAVSVVALQDGVPVLRAHNLTEHLAPLAAEARAAAEARGDRRGAL
jgi:broad specificity phosphatase PhoE